MKLLGNRNSISISAGIGDISLNFVAGYCHWDFRKVTAYNTLTSLGLSVIFGFGATGVAVGVVMNSTIYGLGYGTGSLVAYVSEKTLHEGELSE